MEQPSHDTSLDRPIVGVILGIKPMPLYRMNRYPRLKKLADANLEAKTTLTFFCVDDVDIFNKTINGTYYNYKTKRWEKKQFSYPDVVYVRGGSGKAIDNLLAEFDRLGIKKINPIHAFNKGDLYELLNQDENVRSYLPPTQNVQTMDEIRSMIRKQGTVYVKARRGRKGTKVMRIEKLRNNGYLYSYSILGYLVRKRVNTITDLEKAIKSFFGNRALIVQRAIDLVRVRNNRLCDFRAELQRNKQGEIDIVGVCVRVGRQNSPITTHSSAYRYDTHLKKIFPHYTNEQIEALKEKINTFLIDIYTGVEKKYGKFGEIGIDFAVDRKGKIWLIECNAQSAKVSIVKAYGAKSRRAFLNPLEYAKAIMGTDRSNTVIPSDMMYPKLSIRG
ncbi:YheC/YheD family protein [Paenibacillus sp. EPM92]|uniref:YheC/YheD family endospore coat-associated protein n=1 Tax=Paenibacillus sp. EPM92 TaxID=1561195 RepID=UPI001915168C|nr:YheC/YheD family protein [Paenibacillus sp. EPM92]